MTSEKERLLEIIARHSWWYHTMELGEGVTTPGQYGENLLPVANLMQGVELNGQFCLDIGTMDGKMAFLMENLGGHVVTADVFERETVTDLIDHFGSGVKYRTGIRDHNLLELREEFGHFDFVLCAGVLYHIFSPIDLIALVRRIVKTDGYVIFESACLNNERKSYMRLNWGDLYQEHTTIWIPTIACLRNMLRYFGFELIADSILKGGISRYAVLCKAQVPSVVAKAVNDPWLAALMSGNTPGMSSEYLLPQLDLQDFESAPRSFMPPVQTSRQRRKFGRRLTDCDESRFLKRGTPYRGG